MEEIPRGGGGWGTEKRLSPGMSGLTLGVSGFHSLPDPRSQAAADADESLYWALQTGKERDGSAE